MSLEIPRSFIFSSILYRRVRCKRGCIVVFILFLLLSAYHVQAQEEPIYDELSIFLQVKDIGGIEIPAVIQEDVAYLPVKEIFDFLKFKTTMSQSMDSIFGFFITTNEPYLFDYKKNMITFQGKSFQLNQGDMLRTETNLYLRSNYFGEIFGLNSRFSIRTLSVTMETKLELPAMREKRLDQMRQNINRITGEVKADTTIKRAHPLLYFGMADWSVISTQQIGREEDTRLNLAVGAVVAGGEANVMLNYNTKEIFDEKQQYYYLKFVNNNRSWLRQTILGKIGTEAVSSIFNPVVGVRLTNTPTTYRRSFGTYPMSDYTNPNWTVELYVNNILVDYQQADASGFFTFQVPLVYGNSQVKFKFYGPWGEERSSEQTLTIPFNFMPLKKLEYTAGAGMVEDGKQTIFSRINFNYGLSKEITIGAGVEYLSSVVSGPIMPFAAIATRPFSNLILSGEYMYGVRAKGILSYQFLKNLQMELNYVKYEPGQKAVNYNYLEERKAILTLPIKAKKQSIYNRITYDNIIMPGTQYTTTEWLISGALFGFNTNLTNYGMFSEHSRPYAYSNLSISARLPNGIMLTPQSQFSYSLGKWISAKLVLEKYVFKNGFISLSYENNFLGNMQMTQFGFRYDLPFAQAGFTVRQSNSAITTMEVARGSLIVDPKTGYFGANNRVSVGKGALTFAPFLDLNCNNQRDPGEPKEYDLNIRISGGKPFQNDRDSTIRVLDLEPYTIYFVELDQNSFDNVAWKLKKKTMNIIVDPNQFKIVEIPISVVGEVSGTVNKKGQTSTTGIGRIVINIFDRQSKLVGKTLSESDGYFSFLGLAPGMYYAKIDSAQLKRVQMIADPDTLQFSIEQRRDGDIVEGMDFTLTSLKKEDEIFQEETVVRTEKADYPILPANQTQMVPGQPTIDPTKPGKITTPAATVTSQPKYTAQSATNQVIAPVNTSLPGSGFTFLQVGAFKIIDNASKLSVQLAGIAKCPVVVVFEMGFYKVRLGGFSSKAEMEACKISIVQTGLFKADQIAVVKPSKTGSVAKPALLKADSVQKVSTTTIAKQKPVPVTKGKKQYFVQIGAFIDPRNAQRVTNTLSHAMPHPIGILFQEGKHKVRFGGFDSRKEAEECLSLIEEKDLSIKGIIIIEIDKSEIVGPSGQHSTISNRGPIVQLGSFKERENAHKYHEQIASKVTIPISIVEENGLFSIRTGSFNTMTEAQNCQKSLENKGIKCFIKM